MIDPVVIDFVARGISDVGRAFDTIERRVERFETQATRSARSASRDRVKTAEREGLDKERAYQRVSREAERLQREQTRNQERAARAEVRTAEKTAREVERLEEWKMRVRIRSSEAAGRAAAREAEEELRARKRVESQVRSVGGRSFGHLATGGAMLAGAVGIGGGFMLADAAQREMRAQRAAAQLVNSATIGGVAAPGATNANVMAQASAASKAYGVDKGELIGAVQNYVAKSSDFTGGLANMGFFAKLSTATGTRLEDITGAAGILRAQNKNLSAGDMQQMLLDLSEQGKQGAVEIQDLAHLAGGLGSTRALYAGSATENQRKLLALAQITRTESESPEEAATAVKDLGIEGVKGKHKTVLAGWGVKFNKQGQYEDIQQMLEASLRGSKGNLSSLEEVFGLRGVKAFMRLAPIYNAAGGGDKGIAAVRAEMGPIMNARGSTDRLDQQYQNVMNTPAARMELAINRIKETLAVSLEPALTKLSEKFEKAAPAIEAIVEKGGELAAWLADNPLRGVISIMGASVAKDIAAAAIGESIKQASIKQLSGLSIATLAVTAAAVMIMNKQEEEHRQEGAQQGESAGSVAAEPSATGSALRGGTKADLAKLKQERDKMRNIVNRNQANIGNLGGTVDTVFAGVGTAWDAITGGNETGKAIEEKIKGQQKTYDDSVAALMRFNKAIEILEKKLNSVADNTAPGAPARNVPIPQRGVH